MGEWLKDLDFYFQDQWAKWVKNGSMMPDRLYEGIVRVLGKELEPDLVHPRESDDGSIRFVMVIGDNFHVVRYEAAAHDDGKRATAEPLIEHTCRSL